MRAFDTAVAVVTGAGSGIGLALAQSLSSRGATIVLADIDGQAANARAAELGPQHLGVQLDVADPHAFLALADRVQTEHGGANILVNNAGVAGPGGSPVWASTPDDWEWVLGVNLLGVVNGLRAFVPQLLAAEAAGRPGHIVTTASLSGLLTFPFSGPYTASKHAAVAVAEQVAAELQEAGARIGTTIICPAWVRTSILQSHHLAPATGDRTPPPTEEQLSGLREMMQRDGLSPETLAEAVIRAIEQDLLCVLPAEMADAVVRRAERLTHAAAEHLPGPTP